MADWKERANELAEAINDVAGKLSNITSERAADVAMAAVFRAITEQQIPDLSHLTATGAQIMAGRGSSNQH
jgi:transcription-repair coupling factor (superfamily II helicase)